MRRNVPKDTWFWQVGTEVQRLTEKILHGPARAGVTWQPNVDVLETDGSVEVTIELAGVEPDQVSLYYDPESNSLVVRGRREPGAGDWCARRCYVLEVLYGEFERIISLPSVAIDKDAITARYENGMLYVKIPKGGRGEKRRTVSIA